MIFSDPSEMTAGWLTETLREAGALPHGQVETITIWPNAAFNSLVSHLDVTYSAAAPASAPRELLLKINRDHDGEIEHAFYSSLRAYQPPSFPVVVCYDSAYSPYSGASHLLLRDFSATHRAPVTRQQLLALNAVPAAQYLDQVIDTLARLHAHWWDHPLIGSGTSFFAIRSWYSDLEHYQRHIRRRQDEWAKFNSSTGGFLSPQVRKLYGGVLEAMPSLWERWFSHRLGSGGQITVTHGDCYLTQFLCPLADGATYLVDFDSASANFGPYDLVYLIPTFWTRAQRLEGSREQNLLRRYQLALAAHGVTAYDWDTLLDDYRLALTFMIFDPLWDQVNGSSPAYWQPKLKCLTEAYIDLECAALL